MDNYIRFDWAMKRLLRNKANHAVIEGLLESLLGRKYTIERFLESESNQETEEDKFNRVDILAESDKGELTIIEIQNNRELTYFHRMLYGVSKAITDYIDLGNDYDKVRKVYSINIVYFELGQGNDYVYHGKTFFRGLHNTSDILKLSVRQNQKFFGFGLADGENVLERKEAGDLFPEYYILRVNDFDRVATTPLDQWIEFLKTGSIAPDATAPGLSQARQCLRIDTLSSADKNDYVRHMESIRYQRSVLETSRDEGFAEGKEEGFAEGREEGFAKGKEEGIAKGREEGIAQGREEGRAEGRAEGIDEGKKKEKMAIAKKLSSLGIPTSQIVQATGLTEEEINELT